MNIIVANCPEITLECTICAVVAVFHSVCSWPLFEHFFFLVQFLWMELENHRTVGSDFFFSHFDLTCFLVLRYCQSLVCANVCCVENIIENFNFITF